MPDKRISDLDLLTSLGDGDYLVVGSGNTTYKVTVQTLKNAVKPTLGTKRITTNGIYNAADNGVYGFSSVTVSVQGGDGVELPLVVADGGTGASNKAGARANLGICLQLRTGDAVDLYTALSNISVGETICINMNPAATSTLIADSISSLLSGTVLRISSTQYRFSMGTQTGVYRYEWQASYSNGVWTRDSGYRFTGTSL